MKSDILNSMQYPSGIYHTLISVSTVRDHLSSMYQNFSKKLTFLTHAHVFVYIRGVQHDSFMDNFAYVLNK